MTAPAPHDTIYFFFFMYTLSYNLYIHAIYSKFTHNLFDPINVTNNIVIHM